MMLRIVRITLFLYVVFNNAILSAQGYFVNIDTTFKFINYDKNKLQFPADTGKMENFYSKLDTLVKKGKGKINILHIGGSHVQADMMSNRIRRNLDSLNQGNKSSRGLVFPFKIAKTNNPLNYKVTYTGKWASSRMLKRSSGIELGVMGIAVKTQSPDATVHIRLNRDSTVRWQCTELKILGYCDFDTTGLQPMTKPLIITGSGDTIPSTYGIISDTYEINFENPIDSFTIAFEQADSIFHPFTLSGILVENNDCGITYNSVGVNGASVPSWLGCENFEKELPLVRPDLVIFGIGINDAVSPNFKDSLFISNYEKLIDRIKKVSPDCAFLFVTNNDSYRRINKKYEVNRNGLKVQSAFFELAKRTNGAVWDQFEIMGGLYSMRKWEEVGMARRDKIHFTHEGYKLLGDLLYNALIDSYLSRTKVN